MDGIDPSRRGIDLRDARGIAVADADDHRRTRAEARRRGRDQREIDGGGRAGKEPKESVGVSRRRAPLIVALHACAESRASRRV